MKKFIVALLICFSGYYIPAFSTNSLQEEPSKPKIEALHQEKETIKDFRVSLGGGFAYRLGKIEKLGDASIDQMSKDMRGGYNLDVDFQYFFKEVWGLGLSVNYASASASGNNINIPNFGSFDHLKEVNNFIYVGPTFSMRRDFDKFLLVMNAGFGPLFFNVNDKGDGREILNMNKTTVGFQFNVAGEYKISNRLGAGIKLGFISGSVKIVENSDERMNVSNLGIGGYLSFRSW